MRARDVVRAPAFALLVVAVLGLPACGGSASGSSGVGDDIGSPGPNVQPIVVSPGPANDYANGAFTTVTVCVPGTTTCQSIGGILVDTGSVGLRLVSSLLTLPLPAQNDGAGSPLLECNQFLASYQWGPVLVADVRIAGEQASSVRIQSIGTTAFAVPDGCTRSGLPPQETVETLGANGVLGVGLFQQDCGPACTVTGSRNPGLYFSCPFASGCVPAAVPLAQQLANPVALFPVDNNGVILQLPSVPAGGQASASGSMIFGIGTESNNGMGSALVYPVDDVGNFTTVFQGGSYPGSYLDSGTNGIYFLDSSTTGMPACPDTSDFYCPATTARFTATNQSAGGASPPVDFTIANTDSLFNTPNAAFSDLGGPNPGSFEWGLSFFFGRNVYTAIEQRSTPGGAGPYFAY
jgi:hypothetical protein